MTLDEAQAVADICCTADNGCSYCARALRDELASRFPEFIWVFFEDGFGFRGWRPGITVQINDSVEVQNIDGHNE